jgi:hypothetical protein
MAADPYEAKRMLAEGKQFLGSMWSRRQMASRTSAAAA